MSRVKDGFSSFLNNIVKKLKNIKLDQLWDDLSKKDKDKIEEIWDIHAQEKGKKKNSRKANSNNNSKIINYLEEIFANEEKYHVNIEEREKYFALIKKEHLTDEERQFVNTMKQKLSYIPLTADEETIVNNKMLQTGLSEEYIKELEIRRKSCYYNRILDAYENDNYSMTKEELKDEQDYLNKLLQLSEKIAESVIDQEREKFNKVVGIKEEIKEVKITVEDWLFIRSLGLNINPLISQDLAYLSSVLTTKINLIRCQQALRTQINNNDKEGLYKLAEYYQKYKVIDVLNTIVQQIPQLKNTNIAIKYNEDIQDDTYAAYRNNTIYVGQNLINDILSGRKFSVAIDAIIHEHVHYMQGIDIRKEKNEKVDIAQLENYDQKGKNIMYVLTAMSKLPPDKIASMPSPLKENLERLYTNFNPQEISKAADLLIRGRYCSWGHEVEARKGGYIIGELFYNNVLLNIENEKLKDSLKKDRDKYLEKHKKESEIIQKQSLIYEQFVDFVAENGRVLMKMLDVVVHKTKNEKVVKMRTAVANIVNSKLVDYNKEIDELINEKQNLDFKDIYGCNMFYYELSKRNFDEILDVFNTLMTTDSKLKKTSMYSSCFGEITGSYIVYDAINKLSDLSHIDAAKINDKLFKIAVEDCEKYIPIINEMITHEMLSVEMEIDIIKKGEERRAPVTEYLTKMKPKDFVNKFYIPYVDSKYNEPEYNSGITRNEKNIVNLLFKISEFENKDLAKVDDKTVKWLCEVSKIIPNSAIAKELCKKASSRYTAIYTDYTQLVDYDDLNEIIKKSNNKKNSLKK